MRYAMLQVDRWGDKVLKELIKIINLVDQRAGIKSEEYIPQGIIIERDEHRGISSYHTYKILIPLEEDRIDLGIIEGIKEETKLDIEVRKKGGNLVLSLGEWDDKEVV